MSDSQRSRAHEFYGEKSTPQQPSYGQTLEPIQTQSSHQNTQFTNQTISDLKNRAFEVFKQNTEEDEYEYEYYDETDENESPSK